MGLKENIYSGEYTQNYNSLKAEKNRQSIGILCLFAD